MTRNIVAVCGLVAACVSALGAERVSLFEQTGASASFRVLGEVEGARRVAVPETGGHLLALTTSGRVVAWGQNLYGQLGVGDRAVHGGFVDVGLTDVVGIAAGAEHSLALKSDGTVWAWGANTEGQLGDGTLAGRTRPALVPGLRDVSMVAAGALFSVALKKDGTVWVFGSNWSGIAPDDGRKLVTGAVRIGGMTGIAAVGTRDGVGYALDGEGQVWRWSLDGVRVVEDTSWKASLAQKAAGLANLAPRVGVRVEGGVLRVGERGYAVAGAPLDVAAGWAVAVIAADVAVGASGGVGSTAGVLALQASAAGTVTAAQASGGRSASAVTTVAAGYGTTLVRHADGTVSAWGRNNVGQVGDGTFVDRFHPVCTLLVKNVKALSVSLTHTLALLDDGTVWGWGERLPLGLDAPPSTNRVALPRLVPGIDHAVAVAAGQNFSLALKSDGTVWVWGSTLMGALGLGPNVTRQLAPAQIPGLSGITSIAAGNLHALARRNDGAVFAWGYNPHGELGDGTTITRDVPTQIPSFTADSVAAGESHSLALRNGGTVWAWGDNSRGQAGGQSAPAQVTSPVQAGSFTDVTAVAGGYGYTVVLRADGSVWAWGRTIDTWPDGFNLVGSTPVQLTLPTNAVSLSAGTQTIVAALSDGSVRTWGDNTYGSLGREQRVNTGWFVAPDPEAACSYTAPRRWQTGAKVAAGQAYTVVVRADGTVWAAGANSHGQLGDGSLASRSNPAQVPGLTSIASVFTAANSTFAVGTNGRVYAWGQDATGQLGDGATADRTTPFQVPGVDSVVKVAASATHTLALRSDGTVWGWGADSWSALGPLNQGPQWVPRQLSLLSGIVDVSAGTNFSVALKNDGTVWAWGRDDSGALWMVSTGESATPVQIYGMSDIVAIASGDTFSLALRRDGTVWCWGDGVHGELGEGGSGLAGQTRSVGRVTDLTDVVAIAAKGHIGLALKADGTVWGWGQANSGQFGDISSVVRYDINLVPYVATPFELPQPYGVAAAIAGTDHTLLWGRDGSLWAMGSNQNGQFGLAEPASSLTPVLSGFQPGYPLAVTPVSVTPGSGSASAQGFDVKFRNEGGAGQLQWVQMLIAVAQDGGGAPYCFVHYDVAGHGLWLYGDGGFFLGPVAPGTASNVLQNSFCALDPAATAISGSGAELTLHAQVIFKKDASRNIYLRTMSRAEEDSGWVLAGTWEAAATLKVAPLVNPNSGSGAAATFAAQYSDASGLPASTGGWVQLLVAAASDGGGQPFCFVHYDRGGNGLWMYSSDVGFFLGPVAPGVSSTALQSSACSVNAGGTTVQNANGTLVLTVPMSFTPAMSGAKKVFQRSLDTLWRDSGWLQTGTWVVP